MTLKPDIYIVVPIAPNTTLILQNGFSSQLPTLKQHQDLFILLPDIRVISINPAFITLISPLISEELSKEQVRYLKNLKTQGVIDAYYVVHRHQ